MQRTCTALLFAVAMTGAAATAHAQTFLTPFAGATFGKDAPSQQLTMGAALTVTGPIAGLEIELGYTPDFYGEIEGFDFDTDSNLTTASANLMLGLQRGPIRPYGTAGVGLMRTRIDASDLFGGVSSNDWGVNAGVGLIAMFTDHVGLRGDLRYFRMLNDIDVDDLSVSVSNFDFWRAYGGLAFKF